MSATSFIQWALCHFGHFWFGSKPASCPVKPNLSLPTVCVSPGTCYLFSASVKRPNVFASCRLPFLLTPYILADNKYFPCSNDYRWALLVAQSVKYLPAMHESWVRSLGQETSLGKGMATHSSIVAWRTPWTEESGGLQSMGLQELDMT